VGSFPVKDTIDIFRLCSVIVDAFYLVTQVDTKSFYLFWHSTSNKDKTILVSICATKWEAPCYVVSL